VPANGAVESYPCDGQGVVAEFGITLLCADGNDYQEELFGDVKTYMHGCYFLVTVFEVIGGNQFNPDVALELGYITALRKRGLILKDKSLPALQTNLIGRIYCNFDAQNPDACHPIQVADWVRARLRIDTWSTS
jgi:hypothetical protein